MESISPSSRHRRHRALYLLASAETANPHLFKTLEQLDLQVECLVLDQLEHSHTWKQRPDLVLMPVEPIGAVEQLQRALRCIDDHAPPPLCVMEAPDDLLHASLLEAGAAGCINPPIDHPLCLAMIRRMINLGQVQNRIRRLNSRIQKDQELAKVVFSGAVVQGNVALDQVKSLLQPAETFSGDVLLSAYSPTGDLNILLGDFTGHGLAAAIGALPTAEVFRAMTAKGFAPHQILAGINRKLHSLLPTGMYLAAIFVSIRRKLDYASYCNCGMPDLMFWKSGEALPQRHAAGHFALGIDPSVDYQPLVQTRALNEGDQLILTSDGVIEARNPDGASFGSERLLRIAETCEERESFLLQAAQALALFCGDAPQDDDISLVQIPCRPELFEREAFESIDTPETKLADADDSNRISFSLSLGGQRLHQADPIPLIIHQIQELEGMQSHRRRLFTILTELYINALDHGVLGLDSDLKHSPEGFGKYFEERDRRLGELDQGYVRFNVSSQSVDEGGELVLCIEDSGPGFNYEPYTGLQDIPQENRLSGRGLLLVRELCESLYFHPPGNRVEVRYRWKRE